MRTKKKTAEKQQKHKGTVKKNAIWMNWKKEELDGQFRSEEADG